MRLPAAALAALALILGAACGDSTGATTRDALSFRYAGDATGSFTAAGPAPVPGTGRWSAYAHGVQDGGYIISAYAPTSATRGTRLALVTLQLSGPGTYTSDCTNADDGYRCLAGSLSLQMDHTTPNVDEGEMDLGPEHVTLTVTSAADGRIKGTFSGTFTSRANQRLTVTDGAFDLPLVVR